ncbi:MAG: type IV pilin [Candidatus Bathyarchaeota archaeon]|nr:type IV pilin [Candidatus Bathyarchaeota archaeon]
MRPNKRRAVSPVIATVILVAVTITVAVAVSYWMSNITGQYTSFEKIEIQSGYAVNVAASPAIALEWEDTDGDGVYDEGEVITQEAVDEVLAGWLITLELKNSGTSTATMTSVFINDKPIDQTNIVCLQIDPDLAEPAKMIIESGVAVTVFITINDVEAVTYSSGTTINIKLHSASGMDYIRLIKLS